MDVGSHKGPFFGVNRASGVNSAVMTPMPPVPFNDLRAAYLALQHEIDMALAEALDSGWYILGRQVAAFEAEFAAFTHTAGCVGVNSGTDALVLALRACQIGPGDEVVTVAHTAVATVAAIRLAGAVPVLVDIEPQTYTMDPQALEAAITPATRAVIPVHIYGHAADLAAIQAITRRRGLLLIEDCAQAHGAILDGQPLGSFGDLATFSFYPTKNLGALGDGGAVVGQDLALLERVRLLHEYGWTPAARYVSQIEGTNSRLDELQAAILRVKLRHLDAQNAARRTLAGAYAELLPPEVIRPCARPGATHVYHLYVVRLPQRDRVRRSLDAAGIGTGIHYPVPVHLQPAYGPGVVQHGPLPVTEQAAGEILSLPMYPTLTMEQVARVAGALAQALAAPDTTARA
jgi:dTDP-3-amino-3,4,6-trideoxy-alpha-D-glucose transaminase